MRQASQLQEAEELLEKVRSWTDEEVEELPIVYRKKAREYRNRFFSNADG